MHQDYLRSAVYNSLLKPVLVGCDDGNEMVPCGTTRRHKTPPPDAVGGIPDKGRGSRVLDPTPVGGEEEEEAMAYRENSELQLSQVSRGAQKLTQMIESLSKAPNMDGQSKYIAEDLLRGSLDLQESLIMLRKLQETSKVMSERRRKPKLDLREGREKDADEFGIEDMGARRFAFKGRHDKLQEPRLSVDGSSRNCNEELKKVIRDSLRQQNLLSISSDDENPSLSRSMNFSASCRFEDRSYERKKAMGSVSAIEQPKKAKPPSLIAKLMGLGEVPLETVHPIKKEQEKKSVNLARLSFDVKVAKAMKLPLTEQNPDRKQKSLQDIIETMQFKGLLKSDQLEDQRIQLCFTDTPHSEQYTRNVLKDDEVPPIVIMKPLHLPCQERGEVPKDLLLGKASVQQEIHSVKLVQEKKVTDRERMLPKTLETKEVKKIEKTKLEPFQKAKSLATEFHKQHKKDVIGTCKKTNAAQKPPLYGKKQEEKKDVKAVRALISQANTASAQQVRPDKRLSVAKSDVSKQRSSLPNRNLKYPVRPVSLNSIGSTKEKKTSGAKQVRKSIPNKAVNNNKKLEDGKASDPLCVMDSASTTSTLPNDDLPKQAEKEDKHCDKDGISKDRKIFCEVMPKTSQCEKKSELAEEAAQLPNKATTIRKSSGIKDDMKRLLLSSQSFLSLAQELFGLDSHQPIYYQRKSFEEVVTRNFKFFLDCGKELLARKRHQQELLNHPLKQAHVCDQTVYTSLDQLVEEISNGIEKLISYIVVDGEAAPEDSLYIRLERDLRCEEMLMNVMWDIGWRDRTCVEESDHAVGEVEEHILSFLVEEIVTDLVY